jgi:hypothetical protein
MPSLFILPVNIIIPSTNPQIQAPIIGKIPM